MQTRFIKVPFTSTDEKKSQTIPDLFIFGDIKIGIQFKLPTRNSFILNFKFFASPNELLPFECLISLHNDSKLFDDTQSEASFSYHFPYTMVTCMFSIKTFLDLKSISSIIITIKIKPKSISRLINNNQASNHLDILKILNKNEQATQQDIDTIKKDFQIIKPPTPNTAKKYDNTKFETKLNISDSVAPQNDFLNNKPKIQSKPIKSDGLSEKSSIQSVRQVCYNGILNQGAMCYLSTIIQSLFHIPYFRNVIFQFKANNSKTKNINIISSLQSLFYNLEHGNYPCSSNSLTTSLGMSARDVLIQRDAQEFLIHFTETLENILKEDERQKDKISYIFGGKTIQTVKNSRKQIIGSHEENVFELIIGLSESVEASLRNFIKEEMINDYNDDKTQSVQTVTMQTKLLNLPRVLKLLIKRYQYDKDSKLHYKDNSRMEFNENLDLKPFVYNNEQNICTNYKLYCVIVHQGSINGGHYYAFLKPEMKQDWFLFNDSFVCSVTSRDAIENNFGSLNDNLVYIRNRSAYMLIYIRADSIDEMFMRSSNEIQKPIQIPKTVSSFAEVEKRKELQRVKSEVLCQITFNIFNERCIIENCQKGIVSMFNNEYMINISVDLRLKSNEIYEKVSHEIKLNKNCIRLWILSNDYQKLIRIVKPEEQINQLGVQNLFLEIKNEEENLNQIESKQTYFLILYTKLILKPFLYLKTGHYDLSKFISFGNINIPLRFDKIIFDSLEIINTNLSLSINESKTNVFVTNSLKIEKKYASSICNLDSGSMIILQIDDISFNPNDSIIEKLEEKIGIKRKLQFIKKNANIEKEEQNNNIFNYFDFMMNELPASPVTFFENKNNTKIVKVYNFNDISQIEGTIEIPLKIRSQELISFIGIAFNIENFNVKNESILIFAREENSEVPRSKPIEKFCRPFLKENIDSIYYCVVSNTFARNVSSETRVIQLSENGYSVSKTVCYYLPDNEIHPFEQFRLFNEKLFGQNAMTRMFVINEYKEFGKPIDNENGIEINNKKILRIEKVLSDQISNELVVIQKAKVGKYNKIEVVGDPFYFAYIENEPTSSFKKRIQNFFRKDEFFVVHKKRSYYNDKYAMNDVICIDKWENSKALYLIIDFIEPVKK